MNNEKYEINFSNDFLKSYRELVKKNKRIKKQIDQAVLQLGVDPFSNSLRTHKADTVKYGYKYSSRVTGDLRIIWDFAQGRLALYIFTIAGHEVYK